MSVLRICLFLILGFGVGIASGLVGIGGLIGAKIATAFPSIVLQRIFGVALLAIAIRMIIGGK